MPHAGRQVLGVMVDERADSRLGGCAQDVVQIRRGERIAVVRKPSGIDPWGNFRRFANSVEHAPRFAVDEIRDERRYEDAVQVGV